MALKQETEAGENKAAAREPVGGKKPAKQASGKAAKQQASDKEVKAKMETDDGWKSKSRRPYRFCSRCWIKKKEWILRSLTLPYGQCTNLNEHTNDKCLAWPKGDPPPTAEENRAYAAAFKYAQRRGVLHDIALEEFKQMTPAMAEEELVKYLIT